MFPWGVLITGAVGVGGTSLGAWLNGRMQTKNLRLSLDAENERARLAEKRRIYAKCMAAFHDMTRTEGAKSLDVVYDAISELNLIAPKNIVKLTDDLFDTPIQKLFG